MMPARAAVLGLLALGGSAFWAPQVAAQNDFRNLDRGRPLRVEDAYPIKAREWEVELGTALVGLEGGDLGGAGILELKTGIARNAQFGIEVHGALERVAGASESGLEEFGAHLLYNLNQEGRRSPALSIRVDGSVPGVGETARNDPAARVAAIATRSFGASRVHINAGHSWSAQADGDLAWEGGLAIDHAAGVSSRLIAFDVFAQVPNGQKTRVWIGLGTRLQWSKRAVLDIGVSSRVDEWSEGVPNLGFTVGWSRAFGFRSQAPSPPPGMPRLR